MDRRMFEKGANVRYQGIATGYESDIIGARKHLKLDAVYVVERGKHDGTFDNIWLEGFPNIRFNAKMFVEVHN